MVATPELSFGTDSRRLVIQADGTRSVDVPGGGDILKSHFQHVGDDLLITPAHGQEIVVKDYFGQGVTPDLLIGGRAHLDGALVERLAGPGGNVQVAENNATQTDQVAQAGGEAIGKVDSISGTVTVQHADGSTAQLSAGDPILLHDVVVASSDGVIGIVFLDGTTFSLSAGARMTMDEMVYDASNGGGSFVTSVLQGTFVFNTGSIAPNGNMEVHTPVGTIGIRGTTVAGRLALEGSDTVIILLPDENGHVGRVVIQNAGGIQEITEANAATTLTSFFIAPSQPVIMSGTDILQYFDTVLQQLHQMQGTGPAGNQGGATQDGDASDQAALENFDPSQMSTAAGGEEQAAEPQGTGTLDPLSALLGFVPDPLQPVSFFAVDMFGNVGLGSLLYGTANNYSGSGLTLDYLNPGGGTFPINQPGSPFIFFTGGNGDDTLDATSAGGPSAISGLGGNDTLIGSAYNDQVSAGSGNDLIVGGHGGGNDSYDGGAGVDTVRYASADESIIVNLTTGKAFGDPDIGVDTLVNIENVIGGSGNDVIIGNANANILDGNAGDDQLSGLGGDDTINGNSGIDTAVFTGNAADYEIVFVPEGGYVEVRDFRANADGVDTLYGIEKLRFADQETLVSDLENGLNHAPTTIELTNTTVAEGAVGAVIGTIIVTDPDLGDYDQFILSDTRFEVVADQLRLKDGAALDFETEPSIDLTVTAIDSGGLGHTKTFVIAVQDTNDAPTVPVDSNVATNTVGEDAVAGTVVGITALATDEDSGDVVSYSLTDNAGGRFAIDSITGVITVASVQFDFEGDGAYDVVVQATSNGGLTSSQTFTIQLADVQEAIGAAGDINVSQNVVAENAAIGATVGITVEAKDQDAGDTVSYTLTDNAGNRFAIDAVSGIVTVAGGLDYETATSHDITVLATSSDGSANSQTFTINIGDVNDVPVAVDDTPALHVGALNTVTDGVNLLANDQIGVDTPGLIDAVKLGNGAFVAVDADGTDIYLKANGTAGTAGDNIGTLHINQDGSWNVTQTAGSAAADLQFTYRVTDANGDSDTASFSVDLHNPTPVNYNDVTSTQAVDQQNNIMIVLDCSGSMSTMIGGTTRFQLAKDALANMLSQYDQIGDVNVIVVGFNTSATTMTAWGSSADALNFINSLTPAGNTNYANGITAATNILNNTNLQEQLLGGPTTVYFLSDGEPTAGSSLASNASVRNAWDATLTNNVDRVVAVAMGSDIAVTDQDLVDVANPNGGGSPVNAVIQVNNFNDLSAALATTTASASGNVLNGSLTAGNGDGGVGGVTPDKSGDPVTRLASFSYTDPQQGNGTSSLAISWDGVAAVVTGAAANQVIANVGGVVTFATNFGVMTFFFVDTGQRAAGDFTFTAAASTNEHVENFHYATIDGNNDLDPDGGANLIINIPADHALKVVPVETNFQPGSLSAPQTGDGSANTLEGDSGHNRLDGAGGDDTLNGNDGNDWLVGGAGNDTLNGGNGNDYLDGGAGNDAMTGGAGNDTYIVNSSGDTVTEGPNGGTDTVFASVTHTLTDNVEDLVLTGSSNIDGTGNGSDNHIYGNSGNNFLSGVDGDDYLAGGSGNDTLDAGSGNDFLSGGAGNDVLTGGTGNDVFQVQATTDNYSVGSNTAVSGINPSLYDKITDFDASADKVVFSATYDGTGGWNPGHTFVEGIDFSTIATGYDGTNGTGTAYANHQASLILDANNNLIYDANGADAGYTIVAQIQTVSGSPDVTAHNVAVAS